MLHRLIKREGRRAENSSAEKQRGRIIRLLIKSRSIFSNNSPDTVNKPARSRSTDSTTQRPSQKRRRHRETRTRPASVIGILSPRPQLTTYQISRPMPYGHRRPRLVQRFSQSEVDLRLDRPSQDLSLTGSPDYQEFNTVTLDDSLPSYSSIAWPTHRTVIPARCSEDWSVLDERLTAASPPSRCPSYTP
ncbi:hypothetical protein PM082_000884 [Marasmius tenuissimus]|nr:hypothetical protein PM082_000884 [Marasmius tenuissimus]